MGRAGQGPVVTPYGGRQASLATKHGKAVACGRPLRRALGVELVVPDDFDTDALGTFSIARAAAESDDGVAHVETDMRAHLNPTRMAVIRKLAFRLARRIATPCPGCAAPGFGQTGEVIGLPCEWCESATEMIRLESWSCAACSYREERPRRDGLRRAPAQHCPHCNP